VDTDRRAVGERVVQEYHPYDVWLDPVEGVQASASWTYIILKRLVFIVAALNVFVLAGLLVFHLGAGDGATAAASPDATAAVDEPTPTTSPLDDAGDAEAGDVEATDGSSVNHTPPVADDAVETSDDPPAEATTEVPVGADHSPAYPDPFEPAPNEPQAEAKRLGALVAYVITNYEADSSLAGLLATLPVDPALADSLALQVQAVHHPGMWSRGTVEYAQLGGHLDGRISIMVVVRQDLGVEGAGDPERTETRTMDVRLVRGESGTWEFEAIDSAGGQPVERPEDLSPLAAAVVDDPRIDLPDSAIWDIYTGHTDQPLLQLMLDLAERTPYTAAVLHTGHPLNVFGTPRLSNHTVGRAIDIYAVGPELVVDSHDVTSSLYAVSEWVVSRTDIREFGSPWLFDDAVAHSFTNQVHHDHIHIGVSEVPPVAG
jgi:hypothetical protein